MFMQSENGKHYRITSHPSIFTSRNNDHHQLHDIVIQRRSGFSEGGAMAEDGNLYVIVAVLAKEDLSVLREHERLPPEVTEDMLHQWGFADNVAGVAATKIDHC
ncbi:hypothetical protein GOB57_22185 [Sinorhizobium meliloti]|nr:hypothetical protein [Sinorhizobium meliloti]